MRAIRKCPRSKNGWNGGDIDEMVAMFRNALTGDGNHPSKDSRDHLINHGYAYRVNGVTALTGKGKIAALACWPMPRVWFRMWWRDKEFPFHREDQRGAVN